MTHEQLVEEFKKVRTDAISDMFDNVDEYGIYPTTKFFNTLDAYFLTAITTTAQRVREETIEEMKAFILNETERLFGDNGRGSFEDVMAVRQSNILALLPTLNK